MVGVCNPSADGEAQSRAFLRVGPRVVCPVEPIEDALLIFARNADALIRDDELGLIALRDQGNVHRSAGT